jgi:hypothetical protein
MNDNAGYFSSNRNGSDDIFAFDYKKALVKISGQILTDFKIMGDTKVYLYSYDDNGKKNHPVVSAIVGIHPCRIR